MINYFLVLNLFFK